MVGVAFETQVFEHQAKNWKALTVIQSLRCLFGFQTYITVINCFKRKTGVLVEESWKKKFIQVETFIGR